jgi:hypothetical protein
MTEMKEISLPSGAVLKIQLAPFADSKRLLNALLEEAGALELDLESDINFSLIKNIVCKAFPSDKIDKALAECMKRCLYDDTRITSTTFEPEDARQDYMVVCFEVAKANVMPFMKSLAQKLSKAMEALVGTINKNQKSE